MKKSQTLNVIDYYGNIYDIYLHVSCFLLLNVCIIFTYTYIYICMQVRWILWVINQFQTVFFVAGSEELQHSLDEELQKRAVWSPGNLTDAVMDWSLAYLAVLSRV